MIPLKRKKKFSKDSKFALLGKAVKGEIDLYIIVPYKYFQNLNEDDEEELYLEFDDALFIDPNDEKSLNERINQHLLKSEKTKEVIVFRACNFLKVEVLEPKKTIVKMKK